MPRSASVSVPKRLSFELEDALPRAIITEALPSAKPREYDSWPCDSFFLLPDSVLAMDAGAFRADLKSLDPVLSASLPDWPVENYKSVSSSRSSSPAPGAMHVNMRAPRENNCPERRSFTLLDNHEGLTLRAFGKGTVLIGGGGDGNGLSSTTVGGGVIPSSPSGDASPSTANGPSGPLQQQSSQKLSTTVSPAKQDPSQKDELANVQENYLPPSTDVPPLQGPNELFFGADRSGLSYKDREDRVRQLRERQQLERHQKLEELKEQAAAAQRFREQQETARRLRLDELRSKDSERRVQVEERKRIIQQAEQERRESVLRKSVEREQRLELKRRQERSNAVFAFGSSTPRMLDPKENVANYWGARKATSTTNVNLSDSSPTVRRSSECQDTSDLSRKRATSAHSLNRKPEDLRMSTSMYEVFNWDDGDSHTKPPFQSHASSQGEDPMTQSLIAPPPTAARRRTDLLPSFPSLRDSTTARGSPRHRSPGRTLSLSRLDQLARPRPQRPPSLAPLHESPSKTRRMTPARTMSKSMSHLCPQRARTPIGPATDGVGVPVTDGSLDRRSSRSSLALAHPRMTRSEMLRLSKLRGGVNNAQGFRSGTITPGSPSRPTSALSQASGGSQVSLRNRTSPKKPRPLSIAGSTLSSADKPRDSISSSAASPASPNRESRSIERKSSAGIISTKPLRAKSVGSDSAPSTPAKTPARGTTPKRTPAQVKAESNAKRASERLKSTPKSRSASKTTPLSSPSVESKTLPSSEKKNTTDDKVSENAKAPIELKNLTTDSEKDTTAEELLTSVPSELVPKLEETKKEEKSAEKEADVKLSEVETKEVKLIAKEESPPAQATKNEDQTMETREEPSEEKDNNQPEEKSQFQLEEKSQLQLEEKSQFQLEENLSSQPEDSAQIQPEELTQTQSEEKSQPSSTEKPVTGYATEEEYKVALAEKRRQAREAKERELELERLRKLEEEERERREEEEYLKLMEDQKKAEEERLKRAIEEAEKQREEEAIRREEEEKLRIETEKIEQQKKLEAEEKMRKEEEERQMRKSRVAAIMSRTRGKGGGSTPSKAESKTPSDENKNLNDSLMSASMTEAIFNNLSNSMTDSMIVQVIESQEEAKKTFTSQDTEQIKEEPTPVELLIQPPVSTAPCQATSDGEDVEILTDIASDISSQPLSDFSSQPLSDLSSQPLSDISIQTGSMVELTPQPSSDIQMESVSIESLTQSQDTQETVREMVEEISETNVTDTTVYIETSTSEDLNSSMECMQFVKTRANGNVFDPMDTTPTMQSMDLLGSFNGVNGINHNGMDTVSIQSSGRSGNQFDSFDPFSISLQQTIPTSDVKSDTTTFDQIIDLNQSKLTNEDAMNSNNPPSPIIAFEDNMNKKQSQQNQDNTSNVPDLLL